QDRDMKPLFVLVTLFVLSFVGARATLAEGPIEIDSALSTLVSPTAGRTDPPTISCILWPRGSLQCDDVHVIVTNTSGTPKSLPSCKCGFGLDDYFSLTFAEKSGSVWKIGEELRWTKKGEGWELVSERPKPECLEEVCGY